MSSALAVDSRRGVAQAPVAGTLFGVIHDEQGRLVANALVILVGAERFVYSDAGGRYRFSAITSGRYALRISRIGFAPVVIEGVVVLPDSNAQRDIQLDASIAALSQVTITPGSFTLLDRAASSRLSLSREALLTAPQLAEDLFRSLNRLPGLSGSDFSAKIRVRNGGVDEQLVTLDGLELVEPFHLKDFDGALSILDGESIGRVSVTTGGFTAASGNRQTGLIEMQSAEPAPGRSRTAVGLSVSNMRARGEGSFANGRGAWLVSGRRGYLDLVFKLINEKDPPDPRYFDIFGKVQYRLSANQVATLHALIANDQLRLIDEDSSKVSSRYGNRYVWGTLQSRVTDRIGVTTLASLSALSWRRDVRDVQRLRSRSFDRVRIVDRRELQAASIKQDWTVDFTDHVSLRAGAEYREEGADYDYARQQVERGVQATTVVVLDSMLINAALSPNGARTSGYLSLRLRPHSSLTAEFGARADHHDWTGQTTVSPRSNVAWTPFARTTLRAAWGFYHQAHTLQDLSIVDGDTAFARAERAEHRIVGIEQELPGGWTARAEAYRRLITSPRARYVNVDGRVESPLPEADLDRVRVDPSSARVEGVEVLAQYDRGGHLRGGAAIVVSRARAIVDGKRVPRPFDEPMAATFDLSYRGSNGWTVALAWTARSGWPTASPRFKVDTLAPGRYTARRVPSLPDFNQRLAAYQRVDIRATRSWTTARGRINAWVDLFNAFDRSNQRGYSYSWSLASPSTISVQTTREDFLGRLPTFGLGWEF